MIKLWKFHDAPEHLTNHYPEGLETTWVMEVPADCAVEAEILIQARAASFADLRRHTLQDGSLLFFGSPAPVSKVLA